MWGGNDYDHLMGRWSQVMAPLLVEFACVRDGDNVLDVGCGTGSLTCALLESGPRVQVTGVDGSADFIEIARRKANNDRATFDQGDAQDLPYQEGQFDACVSLLVMNFIPDAARALAEMCRVTRLGGTVTAAVWDYGDGMEMLRNLWDAAAKIDEAAVDKHEGNMPLCRLGELAALWSDRGLVDIADTSLSISMDFTSFNDYWDPFLTGIGPSGSYVSGLEAPTQNSLKDRLCATLAAGSEDTAFSLKARAWAVRGIVSERSQT